jgi:phosphoribosylamine--glycine ligase
MRTKKMNVMVLGYGSREHALAWKIKQSPRVRRVFVAPGNAGIAQIAACVPISDENVPDLVRFVRDQHIDLTVVGTNDPLALGIVDAFQAAGLRIFGPTQTAARLESSKAFAKAFMRRHQIPTGNYAAFQAYAPAMNYLEELPHGRVVVKVSGLGKMGMGVTVCDEKAQARAALHSYFVQRTLGDAAQTVLIEERLTGQELSIFALSDGHNVVPLPAVRDHKRIYDGDQGPNTGGMGAFGPPPEANSALMAEIMDTVMRPTIQGMAAEGNPYVGVLFAGLMLTDNGIQVLEFNCRFGNPEALVLMTLLESDLVEVMLACIDGRLHPGQVTIREGAAAAVVIASPQYPAESFPTGLPIRGLRRAGCLANVALFHHGTGKQDDQLVTARGRVIGVTGYGATLLTAIERAYAGVAQISFPGAHFRRDIGSETNIRTEDQKRTPWFSPSPRLQKVHDRSGV